MGVTDLIYLRDSYVKDVSARVLHLDENGVILDKTIFHPRGGGLESDTGWIVMGEMAYEVKEALFRDGEVWHVVPEHSLVENIQVKLILDWKRRYRMMQYHTALHVLAGILFERGFLISGNHISPQRARVDFKVDKWDPDVLKEAVEEANTFFGEDTPVDIEFISREEFLNRQELVKLYGRTPPNVDPVRIVRIGDIDIQADGGPHVKNLKEVPKIEIKKLENKGRNYKRLYFVFDDLYDLTL